MARLQPATGFIKAVERHALEGLLGLAFVLGATFVRAAFDPLSG